MRFVDLPRNLASDSVLIRETYELAQSNNGRIAVTKIAGAVFRLTRADASLAALLVGDLVANDPRFQVEDGEVILVPDDLESRPLNEISFVVLDVEAITAPPLPPAIIELGAYRVINGQVVDEFQTLIKPPRSVPAFITSLTGITNRDLDGAPVFAEIARDWLDFAGDAVLVAHNIDFDLPLLNREIGRI